MLKSVLHPSLRRIVRFHCRASKAQSVCLAGTFNNWNPRVTPMRRNGEGEWIADVELALGYHEFLFVVDGHWCSRPVVRDPGPAEAGNGQDAMTRVNRFELCPAGLRPPDEPGA